MGKYRVYWIYDKATKQAYVGKGSDGRIEGEHSLAYEKLVRRPGTAQCETYPFSSAKDAFIAEAALIAVVDSLPGVRLLNRQKRYSERFGPRYPFKLVKKTVGAKAFARAIVVTIKPDAIDQRIAPNSRWKSEDLAERVRKWWPLSRERAEQWSRGIDAPQILVAVLKTSGIIAAVYDIDNDRWFEDPENGRRIRAVPLKNPAKPNANGMQGRIFTGDRRGPLVWYGRSVG